jgi:hypothetical protein
VAEVCREPTAALRERLRMRVHALDGREIRRVRRETLRDLEHHFCGDLNAALEETI